MACRGTTLLSVWKQALLSSSLYCFSCLENAEWFAGEKCLHCITHLSRSGQDMNVTDCSYDLESVSGRETDLFLLSKRHEVNIDKI